MAERVNLPALGCGSSGGVPGPRMTAKSRSVVPAPRKLVKSMIAGKLKQLIRQAVNADVIGVAGNRVYPDTSPGN